jgi:dihydroorotate dehydrogenase
VVLYRLLYALVLRRIPAESAHALAAHGVRLAHRLGLLRLAGRPDPVLAVDALGLRFASPLGVAAGVDKDASWFEGLGALGFGSVEVGTVTPLPQEGNPRPRVRRLVADRALQNSMGFPNPGAAAVAERLAGRRGSTVLGVNVGRAKGSTTEQAADDYRASVRRLAPMADYLALNVSSPNTPGLRDLQAVEPLRGLVAAVLQELAALGLERPVLVKIAPDLADEDVDAVADLALELGLAGIIATNTTVDRAGLATPDVPPEGGISGAPLKARSLAVLRRLRARAGDGLVLVSVGGIESADDAWERLQAGATLVQAYTGFVYGGPAWPRRVNRELARRLRGAMPPAGVEPASRA